MCTHTLRIQYPVRSMARKESAHKEQIEALHAKLTVAQGVGAKTTLANEVCRRYGDKRLKV